MKRKQTKDQAKAAKMGKLDPDSELNRSAKEELEERARNKRKLRDLEAEEEQTDNDDDDEGDSNIIALAGLEKEKPLEGLKKKQSKEVSEDDDEPSPKKVKVDEGGSHVEAKNDIAAIPNKKMTKEERKSTKKLKKEKLKAKLEKTPSRANPADPEPEDNNSAIHKTTIQPLAEVEADHDDDMAPIDVSGLVADDEDSGSAEGSTPNSPVFDSNLDVKSASVDATSTNTSIASAVPPSEKPRYIKLPADTTALRARLEAKLEALRANRKAGDQIRTRSELIESRREKQAQRRAHKKEMRLKAKEEEDRKREETLTSSRNSPMSMLSPMLNDPDDGRSANHFAFGRLAFSDGTKMSHDLSYQKPATDKKKGPSDPKSALAKVEAQKKRLAGMDEDKRKEVLEKETWLAARRRAEGEKVHDNEALLKKAVKRKEKAKKKSEREWKERVQSVDKSIKDRQNKRTENIRKRREEKGSKGKKKGGASKPKNRPGFEGSFGGGGKKK